MPDAHEWPRAALSDLVESAVDGPFGSNLKTEHYVSEPGVRVVRLQNVGRGSFVEGDGAFVSARHGARLHRHEVRADDIIVASLGDDRHPFGRACLYPAHLAPGIVKADCFRLRMDTARVAPGFIMRALNVDSLRAGLAGLAQGVTRDRVNLGNLLKFRVPIPPLPEQRRIAEILDTVDEAIRKTEEIIAKLKQVKQGLLHDLLTRGIDDNGELRDPDRHPEQFKDSPLGRVPKAWEPAKLGDLVSTSRPIVYGILMPGQGHPDGVPVVKVKDIKNGVVASDGLLLTSPAIDYEYRRSRLREGDLLFTIRGTVGRTAFVPARLHDANITQDTARIGLVRGNPDFVREYLSMPRPRAFIETHTIGVAVKGINLGDVRRIPVALPPQVEADEIASRLLAHRQRTEIERGEVSKLRLVKQGLMEDLLSNRVRVTALLEEAAE